MENDIAEKMWQAIVTNNQVVEPKTEAVPIIEQKKFLKKNLSAVSVQDRIDIGQIIIMNNARQHIKSCSEGTLVDLDKLSNNIITQMYDMLNHKLEKLKI